MNLKDLFFPFNGEGWEGVKKMKYKDLGRGWKGVSRYVFTRRLKDLSFEVRYFEVEEGGYTSLEKHSHKHIVIGVKGSGRVIVGERVIELNPLDVLIIPSWTPHQFINKNGSPFGFFCIVEKERDKPRELDEEEIEDLMKKDELRSIIKIE
jgi:quercetin dioxygenase-like cupin family protein